MLAVRLSTREARQALAASYLAASRLLPEAAAPAELLGHLCAWSAAQLDEVRGGRMGRKRGRARRAAGASVRMVGCPAG